MDIQHKDGSHRGSFFIEQEGKRVALLAYDKPDENLLVIEHTEVDRSLRGKNIGYELVHAVVEYARKEGKKISPVCPFAKAIFEKKPAFGDVLA